VTQALITGVSGQDGSCLAELLLARGDEVIGVVTPGDSWLAAQPPTLAQVRLLVADMRDGASLVAAVEAAQPEEVYNLAAVSQPGRLWDELELAYDLVGLGVARPLAALRTVGGGGFAGLRFCQASSSEVFGVASGQQQHERTPLRPRWPYGSAKVFAQHLVINHRDALGLFGCCAVLFNHESPRRHRRLSSPARSRGRRRRSLRGDTPSFASVASTHGATGGTPRTTCGR